MKGKKHTGKSSLIENIGGKKKLLRIPFSEFLKENVAVAQKVVEVFAKRLSIEINYRKVEVTEKSSGGFSIRTPNSSFLPTGKIGGWLGGRLVVKEHSSPIEITYKEFAEIFCKQGVKAIAIKSVSNDNIAIDEAGNLGKQSIDVFNAIANFFDAIKADSNTLLFLELRAPINQKISNQISKIFRDICGSTSVALIDLDEKKGTVI